MERKLATSAVLVVLVLTSGCLGVILGDSLAFSANKATVDEKTVSDTGYETADVKQKTVKQTFEAAGQSRDVEVTNWVAQYEKSAGVPGVAEGTVSKFVVLSSPKVEVFEQKFNPLARYSDKKMVEKFVAGYANIRDVQRVGSNNVTMLGSETEVSKFTGTAKTNGVSVDVNVHVAQVEHGDDIVVVLAVYPEKIDESENVYRLIEGIEHEE
ncbi:DUF6517 family protein [Haladaptatus sp. NG-WS-4]